MNQLNALSNRVEYYALMVQKDDGHSAPLCQICGKAMMLEHKKTQVVQPAAWPRPVGWFR